MALFCSAWIGEGQKSCVICFVSAYAVTQTDISDIRPYRLQNCAEPPPCEWATADRSCTPHTLFSAGLVSPLGSRLQGQGSAPAFNLPWQSRSCQLGFEWVCFSFWIAPPHWSSAAGFGFCCCFTLCWLPLIKTISNAPTGRLTALAVDIAPFKGLHNVLPCSLPVISVLGSVYTAASSPFVLKICTMFHVNIVGIAALLSTGKYFVQLLESLFGRLLCKRTPAQHIDWWQFRALVCHSF